MSKFIVVEGIDGSGTSTQSKALAAALTAQGLSAHLTWEPTEGPIGRVLRDLLSGRQKSSGNAREDRRLFAMLFAADRHDHIHEQENGIKARLARGEYVVCARYLLSSLAYEGDSLEELHFVETLNARFPTPDLTVYLDCPVEVALERIHSTRDAVDVFENKDKLSRVRNNYEKLLTGYRGRSLLVDARRKPEEITAETLALLRTL